jgi:hypothetical protein
MKLRIFWDVLPCSWLNVDIQLSTRQYIPEDSELHTRRREELKSHKFVIEGTTVKMNLYDQLGTFLQFIMAEDFVCLKYQACNLIERSLI